MSTDDSDTTVKTKAKTQEDIELELANISQEDFDPSEFYEYANSSLPSELEYPQDTNLESSEPMPSSDDTSKDLLASEYIKNVTAQMLAENAKEEQLSPSALINSIQVQNKLNEGKKATSLLEAKAAETAKSEQEAERLKAEQEAASIKASVEASENDQQPQPQINADAQQQAADEAARIKAAAQQVSQSPEELLKAYVDAQSPDKKINDESQIAPVETPVEAPIEKPVENAASTPEELKLQTSAPAAVMQSMKIAANDNAGLYSGSTPARAKVIPLFPNAQQNRPEEAPVYSPELAVSDKFIHDLATKRLARKEDPELALLIAQGEKYAEKEASLNEKIEKNNIGREKSERALARVEILHHGDRIAPVEPSLSSSAAKPGNAQPGSAANAPTSAQNDQQSTASNAPSESDAGKENDADNPSNEDKPDSMLSVKNNDKTGGMSVQADLNQAGAMFAGMAHGAITGTFASLAGVGYGIYRTLRHAGIEHRVEQNIKHVRGLEDLHKKRNEHAKKVRDHIEAMEKKEATADAKNAKKVDLVKRGKEANKVNPASDYQASVDRKDIDLLDCNKLTKTHLNNVYSEYDKFNQSNKALDDKKNPLSEAERVKVKDATRNAFDKYLRNAAGLNNNIGQNLKKGDDGDIAAAGLLSKMNIDMQTNVAKSKKKGNLRSQNNDEKAMSQVMKKTGALLSSLAKALKNTFGAMGKKTSPKA